MQDSPRVRVKRDCCRHSTHCFCPFDHRLHDPLVAEMQAVEDAERQDGRPENVGVLGAVKYLHNPKEDSSLGGTHWQPGRIQGVPLYYEIYQSL